jgi:polysaccharide export outer membrane protein
MSMMSKAAGIMAAALIAASATAFAQGRAAANRPAPPPPDTSEFVIGAEDLLTVLFWRDKELSGDVTVRSDGMITLPLVGDVRADGRTPTQLAEDIKNLAARFLTEPVVNVFVRQVNSRKVYITGEVKMPGMYPLTSPRTVIQLIAMAGGVLEFAKRNDITVLRKDGTASRAFRFNYDNVARGQSLEQNLELRPGDTIVVP